MMSTRSYESARSGQDHAATLATSELNNDAKALQLQLQLQLQLSPTLAVLPDELVLRVLCFLEVNDLLILSRVRAGPVRLR